MSHRRLPRLFNPFTWPISVKVPMAVVILMLVVSAIITNRVLARLAETQERHLEDLASAYMDGLSASLIPSVVREDIWEVFDTLDRARERYRALNVTWTVVTDATGKVIASSDPGQFPTEATLSPDVVKNFVPARQVMFAPDLATAFLSRPLEYQDREIGGIYAVADVRELLKERSDVFTTLVLTNTLLTLLIAAGGYFAIRQMIRPVGVLSARLDRGAQGPIEPIPESIVARHGDEFRRLFGRYNALANAVNEREVFAARLAEEERLASLGRLASGLAHEINNPLGGMLNALDALQRHGDRESVRVTSFRLLQQGLSGIRDLVRSTLAVYRGDSNPRQLEVADIDDLRLLIKPEIDRKQLRVSWENELTDRTNVRASPVRDAILNLLLNACEASPENGLICFKAQVNEIALTISIADEGEGLPSDIREFLEKPGAGSAPVDRRSGLGLWMVKRICQELRGELRSSMNANRGTVVTITIPITEQVLKHVA